MTDRRLLPSGERAVLVELPDAHAAHGLAAALRQLEDPRIIELVPGARTVLVVARSAADLNTLRPLVAEVPVRTITRAGTAQVTIDVCYDGADLADVARLAGLDVDEVVRRHSGARYVVELIGFAPGFGYLTGLNPALQLPRLGTPRTEVPAGSVAIAGPYTAVYPRSSPGGWRLLGHTDVTLFDPDRDPPALLQAGTEVRFVPR